mmetsp:Transcript_39070/g.94471  ORF Transcript_39070/g.94471 Transcript_39070/m.94471 type:complete len:323 (+) Transcript_39070:162-1130(+)
MITSNHPQDHLEDILEVTEAGEDPTEFKDEEAKQPAKPQKNPLFRDVEETGRWGELQRKEIYGVLICGTLFVILVAAIFFWISFSTTKESSEVPHARAKLDTVLGILQERNHTSIEMPSDMSFYTNVVDDESSPAYHRAMKWLLSDTLALHDEYFLRFVLSSLYFDLGGEAWKNSTNWLTGAKTCDWFGVECAFGNEHFQGLNLDNNHLMGTLPSTIGLLNNVSNIWLSDNALHGPIPGAAFAKLSKLAVLFVDNNRLSGTVPAELGNLSNLGLLYVQENNLSGQWPFCLNNETKHYKKYGFDSDKITCSVDCCESFGESNL